MLKNINSDKFLENEYNKTISLYMNYTNKSPNF